MAATEWDSVLWLHRVGQCFVAAIERDSVCICRVGLKPV